LIEKEYIELLMLRNLDKNITQKALAKEFGFSIGKINYILNALIDKGLVKVENFANSKTKKQYKYLLTKKGIQEKINLTKKFIEKKKLEYEMLQRDLREYEMLQNRIDK